MTDAEKFQLKKAIMHAEQARYHKRMAKALMAGLIVRVGAKQINEYAKQNFANFVN